MNGTAKGVKMWQKLQHSLIMKFDLSSKFDLYYYGQLNFLRIKLSVAIGNGQENTCASTIYFAGYGILWKTFQIYNLVRWYN